MIQLFGGCYCSELTVHPKNWKEKGASIKNKNGDLVEWYISYRFYDPAVKDEAGKIKPCLRQVKGMNRFRSVSERREATRLLLNEELNLLQVKGYNPITKIFMAPIDDEAVLQIDPGTPFFEALSQCHQLLDCAKTTKDDIKSNLTYIKAAAEQLRYQFLPIKDVRRKHIYTLLKRLAVIKPKMDIVVKNRKGEEKVIGKSRWTNNTFNQYRKNLRILFEELIELQATEVNAVDGIKKKKHAVRKKEVLTPAEQRMVDEFARKYDPRFWILIHIFYHSGARTTEMFRVQGKHVNLQKQTVTYLELKGKSSQWIERPIVDEALPFWQMAMRHCGGEDFVFSVGLVPGPIPNHPKQAGIRWKRHIKQKLGINVGWYELKHLNITTNVEQVLAELQTAEEIVAEVTKHKSTKMIAKVYNINAVKNKSDLLKRKSKKFG